ncbi:cytochrome c [Oceanicella sp. SM1341]|uniref:cytochrome c n=1 Tax=Oceanicella sp. SM1341 TaxID=1548889 RepID=UPI000E470147|nr:cytochrome c [Oceanicella sp. SM1341]
MRLSFSAACAAVLPCLPAAPVPAQEAPPHVSESILQRQEGMYAMEAALDALERMTDGRLAPDTGLAIDLAVRLSVWAGSLADAFPDTPASRWGPASRARQEVWTDPGGFLARALALEEATGALTRGLAAGGAALVGPQTRAVRAACTACHAGYLAP